MAVSNTLCEFCDSFKFDALGFHEIEPRCDDFYEAKYFKSKFESYLKENLDKKRKGTLEAVYQSEFDRLEKILEEANADRYEAEYKKFKTRRYGSFYSPSNLPRKRRFGRILEGAGACDFCMKVVEHLRECHSEGMNHVTHDSIANFSFERVNNNPGCLLRLWISIEIPKPSTEGDAYSFLLQFQKCNQQPLKVEDFCNSGSLFDWEESGPEQLFSGRIRPLVADTRLLHKWKENCVEKHDNCISSSTRQQLPWLRLIDVEKRCVIDCFLHGEKGYCVGDDIGIGYAALSYVWGKYKLVQSKKVMPELDKSTEKLFREPGSLTREMVLSTIDDAIEVAQCIGEKYLWVDCLCIRQDDEADKAKFIPQMDLIYGYASVTIVAASGDNADAGLPGVKHDSSTRRKQMPFQIKGVTLLQTLDQGRAEPPIRKNYRYLGDSLWCKRGWTLQEKIFSVRTLIFSPNQIYWECQEATWCEDGVWETQNSSSAIRHCFGDVNNFKRPWTLEQAFRVSSEDNSILLDPYRGLVEEYSERALTEQSDGRDAFEGVLSTLETESGQHFIWALPTTFLGNALMWRQDTSLERRLDSCAMRFSDGRITKCSFPSWSWLGWVGKVMYDNIFIAYTDAIFYYLDGNGKLVQAPGHINDDPTTTITHEDISDSILALNVASSILFFWGETAKLHVVRGSANRYGYKQLFLNSHGENLCELRWVHHPAPDLGPDELAEFVLFGKTVASHLLLLIERKDTGVAYRLGLAEIGNSGWNEVDNRVFKMICLG